MSRRNFIIILTTTVISITALIYYNLNHGMKPVNQSPNNVDYLGVSEQFLEIIEKRWLWGDIEGLYEKKQLNCPEFIKYSPKVFKNYLVCNPQYIHCFIGEGIKQGDYLLKIKEQTSSNPVQFHFEIEKMSLNEIVYDFKAQFERKCHEVELPEREYSLESLGGKKWSHFGRKIFIDKFLVTNNDLILADMMDTDDIPIEERGLPAMRLSRQEQRKYCHSQGKSLMQAHLFEAAIRLQPSHKLSPYPWSHYSQTSVEGLVRAKITEDNCKRSYLKECKSDYHWRSFDTDSVSWTGLHDVFGGPPERFENIYQPNLSYKSADWNTSFKDKKAKIGFKSYEKDPEASFRCYREAL